MKTNANPKNVIKAVETVSKNIYGGNVIFRRYPEKLTKNVIRFTLKTKDANKPGSMVTKEGLKQPKANWQVHEDVMKELFKLEPKPNIYVDTTYGRQYNENFSTTEVSEAVREENTEETEAAEESSQKSETLTRKEKTPRNARKVAKVTKKQQKMEFSKFVKALKYVFDHKELLDEVEA